MKSTKPREKNKPRRVPDGYHLAKPRRVPDGYHLAKLRRSSGAVSLRRAGDRVPGGLVRLTRHAPELGYHPAKLVLLGPEGTFSSYAARKLRGSFEYEFVGAIEKVFSRTKDEVYGFLPIKNKLVGKLGKIERVFKKGNFKILKRVRLPVRFALMAKKPPALRATRPGGKIPLRAIKTLYCVKIARLQCKKFLKENLPKVSLKERFDSNTEVFKKIVQLKRKSAKESAAIGPEKSAERYGLYVLARNIQDDLDDWTEFVLFRRVEVKPRSKRIVFTR